VDERAVDLAIALAVASSLRGRPVPADLAVFGEVGLAGEIRAVPRPAARIAEARKMGFRTLLVPRSNADRLGDEDREGVEIVSVSTLGQALESAIQ
jgi:DNA repair protein RadA/Sms